MLKFKSHIYPLLLLPFIFGVFTFVPVEIGRAQILELNQKIFGMDCAPCAKGMKARMERLDGVDSAELNLNKGKARLMFAEDHETSLERIHQSIIDGGFSPKKARIKVRGTLQSSNKKKQLKTGSGDVFVLEGADTNRLDEKSGQVIVVEGSVEKKDDKERWILKVRQLQIFE